MTMVVYHNESTSSIRIWLLFVYIQRQEPVVVKVRQGKALQFIPPPHRDSSSATISQEFFHCIFLSPFLLSQATFFRFPSHLMLSIGEFLATFLTFAALVLEIFVLVSGSGNLPVLRSLYFASVEYENKFTRLGLW